MKNLNQLVCVALMLSCFQAYRSYIAAAAPTSNNQLNVMNGTSWNVTVRYTTPAGVVTTDTISPSGSKIIGVNQNDPVTYLLSKEKVQTEAHAVPLSAIQQGTLQITTDMIKDLIAPFIQPAIIPAISTAHGPVALPIIATPTPLPTK